MLSITGSLLDDPSNPPALPAVSRRTPSASPELPEPPAKRPYRPRASVGKPAATPSKAQHLTFDEPAAEPAAAAEAEPEVDTSKMNPRELKKYRKEQEKAKRDARKARKEGAAAEAETGTKRKADEEDGGERKKRKEA